MKDMEKRNNIIYLDLRSFGTIGFQDAPNGLWLGKHKIKQKDLLKILADSCIKNSVDISTITTEDDLIQSGYPEDRMGFLLKQVLNLPKEYKAEILDQNLLRVSNERGSVLFVNSETIHAEKNKNWNWKGLKVHVIGANRITKYYKTPQEVARYCRKQKGLLTFLSGINSSNFPLAEEIAKDCQGIIVHDANNTFDEFYSKMPLIGRYLSKFSRKNNQDAEELAERFGKPAIAVSSSHFPSQMGRAGLFSHRGYLDPDKVKDTSNFLFRLENIISHNKKERETFSNHLGYNSKIEVLRFAYLLTRYGSNPDRFKGAESSYNYPEKVSLSS